MGLTSPPPSSFRLASYRRRAEPVDADVRPVPSCFAGSRDIMPGRWLVAGLAEGRGGRPAGPAAATRPPARPRRRSSRLGPAPTLAPAGSARPCAQSEVNRAIVLEDTPYVPQSEVIRAIMLEDISHLPQSEVIRAIMLGRDVPDPGPPAQRARMSGYPLLLPFASRNALHRGNGGAYHARRPVGRPIE